MNRTANLMRADVWAGVSQATRRRAGGPRRVARLRCVGAVVLAAASAAAAAASADHDCVIAPRQTVEIRAASPGLVEDVRVRRGDAVKAGQPIVVLDSSQERAGLDVAAFRATMTGAQKVAEARVDFSTRKAARQVDLAAQHFISVQDAESAQAERRLAEAELLNAQESRRLAALEQKRLAEQLRLRTLRAPFDGIVTERLLHPGELAGSDDASKPILKLADLSVLHIEAVLPAALWSRVQPGQAATVRPAMDGLPALTARVTVVDRVLDAASDSFGLRLEVDNPQARVPAGIRCRVELTGLASGAPTAGSAVPVSARSRP